MGGAITKIQIRTSCDLFEGVRDVIHNWSRDKKYSYHSSYHCPS